MMKKCGCGTSKLAKALVIIGGLNWGLVGVGMIFKGAGWNVVNMLLGSMPMLEAIVYLLVGVSAIVMMFGCKCRKCKDCMVDDKAPSMGQGM